jgi:ABC-2 type transport system permease protein
MQKEKAPKSIGSKLALTLAFYALFGSFSAFFAKQPLFALSVYLHASTLMFIGLFVASSAGEALFNKEEGDILLHRPITPRALLWAKVSVIVQICLWLAGAFNLVGFVIGTVNGGWWFTLAHALSTVMEALFCVGLVVVTYQLCLRWFGRERLDGLITTAQTVMSVALVLGSQLAPRFLMRPGNPIGRLFDSWWIALLPPAWFAGFDDAIAGSRSAGSWVMAGAAVAATGIVLWAGFGTLARDYAAGLQTLQESATNKPGRRSRRRLLERFAHAPPLRWFLRDSVTRASFLLSTAYLARDRDVKLRVYPGLAPLLMMPIIFLMQGRGQAGQGDFGVAFAGAYLGLLPMLGLGFLKYSQQWQAAEIFRAAPLPGPAQLCHGARIATLFFITLPTLIALAVVIVVFAIKADALKMLLPGLIALPVFAIVPCIKGDAIPFSQPAEEAKQAGRGLQMLVVMFIAMGMSGVAMLANTFGLFWWFLLVEATLAAGIYKWMHCRCARALWPRSE